MGSPTDDDRAPRVGRRQFWLAVAGALLIVAFTATGFAYFGRTKVQAVIKRVDDHVRRVPIPDDILKNVDPGGPQTILVLGSDHRSKKAIDGIGQGKYGNSDTMMLIRLNPDAKATTILSIPRDLQVEIPGVGVEKINAAYAEGGPALAIKTVTAVTGLDINHFVDIDFLGFARAVNALKCLYIDVDRRYFNDNNPPVGGGGAYAEIDVPAGYQRLCGLDSLSYVRFRHLDSDFLRAARQQSFLQQARKQVPLDTLLTKGGTLLDKLSAETTTDVKGEQWFQLLKLAVGAVGHPVVQIPFPGDTPEPAYEGAPSYVTVTPENLARVVERFMEPAKQVRKEKRAAAKKPASKTKAKAKVRRERTSVPQGLMRDDTVGRDLGRTLVASAKMPVLAPTLMADTAQYVESGSRGYTIVDRDGKKHGAYRIVVDSGLGGPGHYYGIQGTSWDDPPILDDPDETVEQAGRTLQVYYDGKKTKLVAWKDGGDVYWVSNTLQNELSYGQMVGIAKSLAPVK
jgi:polyisoprenyl-teichoic acid--peptidoglycan teichoic acid transferase